MFLFVIGAYTLIGYMEIVPLIKENREDLVWFSVLFFAAFIMSLLLSLGIQFPRPESAIQMIVESIVG